MITTLVFLVLLAVAVYLVVKLTVAILKYLATNAIVGLILLWVLNTLGIAHVEYNLLNVLIVAVGGIVGVFLLVILSWL